MCAILCISRNSFYKWKKNIDIVKKNKMIALKLKITEIWKRSRKLYGSLKITKILATEGFNYHASYISKLMKEIGIKSLTKIRYVVTTNSNPKYNISQNILDRKFKVNELGKVWVSDITYIRCKDRWIYLTTMIDLADRKIVGWSLSEDMTAENTVYKAWIQARKNRDIVDNDFIFHSDRGVQYACEKMTKLFKYNNKITQSMSRKGNCWDNAVAESFFKTIKCELIYRTSFNSFTQAYEKIENYIDWYNTKRLHQSLGYLTPLEKELQLIKIKIKRAA